MRLCVIGTFYRRYDESRAAIKAVLASTRVPDEFWLMCETLEDLRNALEALPSPHPPCIHLGLLPTPKLSDGRYALVPFSNKINYVLDRSQCDLFAYLDNWSHPSPLKYELMAQAAEGANMVYCTQTRTGYGPHTMVADKEIEEPCSVLNWTQVMHRKSPVRWSLKMSDAMPTDLCDAVFFDNLQIFFSGETFKPVQSTEALDYHHLSTTAAQI